jgi:hypothetical protein
MLPKEESTPQHRTRLCRPWSSGHASVAHGRRHRRVPESASPADVRMWEPRVRCSRCPSVRSSGSDRFARGATDLGRPAPTEHPHQLWRNARALARAPRDRRPWNANPRAATTGGVAACHARFGWRLDHLHDRSHRRARGCCRDAACAAAWTGRVRSRSSVTSAPLARSGDCGRSGSRPHRYLRQQ